MISFFRNLYYKIRYYYKLEDAKAELREWSAWLQAGGLPTFKRMMAQFKWRSDGGYEWIPDSPEMVVARGWKDDCDGAAVIAEWGFKKIGMPCRIYRLDRKGGGHRVTVTNDHAYFTSNASVIEIPPGIDWKGYIKNWDWHKGQKYRSIKKV